MLLIVKVIKVSSGTSLLIYHCGKEKLIIEQKIRQTLKIIIKLTKYAQERKY